jgi:(p)ppGpp synthase/HD superfamily hydrolase
VVGDTEPVPQLTFQRHLPLARAAVDLAVQLHAGQLREADGASFVMHPMEVAELLDRLDYPDHVVAAAVLHDVLENTDEDVLDLHERFGPAVAGLVAAVSDDPAIADEDARKNGLRERVRAIGGDAAAVYAADKVSKVRELHTAIAAGTPWVGLEPKLRRHQASLAMLEETLPDSPLVALLRGEIEAVVNMR